MGVGVLNAGFGVLNKIFGNMIPEWNPHMPRGAPKLPEPNHAKEKHAGVERKVVYLPSCVTRMMGPSKADANLEGVADAMMSILAKADYEVVYPKGLSDQCCGMLFNARGFKDTAIPKAAQLEEAWLEASENGQYPNGSDTSPCLAALKSSCRDPA